MSRPKIHAILPAAGHSRRMGTSKLLLPWGTSTVIEHLLSRLLEADLASISILIRWDDAALKDRLQAFRAAQSFDRSKRWRVLHAAQPPDEMRDSVAVVMDYVTKVSFAEDADGWMLLPADTVAVSPGTLSNLLEQWQRGGQDILIPTHNGRRGHPALFAWRLASRIDGIPPGHGINWFCSQPEFRIQEFPVDDPAVLADLDTPEDYDRWRDAADR
jgi:molybdenum cofactor cytidylyltransferase